MIQELIERVTAAGVFLGIDDGRLRGRPADLLEPFAAELRRYKPDLIAYLTRPRPEPDQWANTFTAWLGRRCAVSKRFSTNVTVLYRDFCAWCLADRDIACDRDGFEALVTQFGLTFLHLHDLTFVTQLALIEDVDELRMMYSREGNRTAKSRKAQASV